MGSRVSNLMRGAVIGAIAILVIVVGFLIFNGDDDDGRDAAGPTTSVAGTTTVAASTSATQPEQSTTPTTVTTTGASSESTVGATTTTIDSVPSDPPPTLLVLKADGMYLDDRRVSSDAKAHAVAWVDGTIVTEATPNGGVVWMLPDGTEGWLDFDAESRFAGGGTIDGQRIVLYVLEIPASEGDISFLALHLRWLNLDEYVAYLGGSLDDYRNGDIGIVGGYEAGYSSVSASSAEVAVGWVGEGLAGIQLYQLDGTVVATGLAVDFEFDAFVTPWLSPDGETLVSLKSDQIHLWDVSTGEKVGSHALFTAGVPSEIVAFDGTLAYVALDGGDGAAMTIAIDVMDGTPFDLGAGVSTPLLPMP